MLIIYIAIRIIQKVCPEEEIKGKLRANWDEHLTRSKK
jgi:hypothetical protein